MTVSTTAKIRQFMVLVGESGKGSAWVQRGGGATLRYQVKCRLDGCAWRTPKIGESFSGALDLWADHLDAHGLECAWSTHKARGTSRSAALNAYVDRIFDADSE